MLYLGGIGSGSDALALVRLCFVILFELQNVFIRIIRVFAAAWWSTW